MLRHRKATAAWYLPLMHKVWSGHAASYVVRTWEAWCQGDADQVDGQVKLWRLQICKGTERNSVILRAGRARKLQVHDQCHLSKAKGSTITCHLARKRTILADESVVLCMGVVCSLVKIKLALDSVRVHAETETRVYQNCKEITSFLFICFRKNFVISGIVAKLVLFLRIGDNIHPYGRWGVKISLIDREHCKIGFHLIGFQLYTHLYIQIGYFTCLNMFSRHKKVCGASVSDFSPSVNTTLRTPGNILR